MSPSLNKILIIEDNPFDYHFSRNLLKKRDGHLIVEGVSRMSDAKKILCDLSFDLIFLDLNLPDSSGLNSLHTLLSIAPQIPVVVLTSNDDKETAINALNAGAQDYLIKGEITGSILERSIRYAFERKQSADRLKKQNDFLYLPSCR